GLISFLVEENGFNHYRVTKAIQKIEASSKKSSQIRSTSSKQVVSSSFLERKETKCVLGAFDLPVKPKVFSHGIDELGAILQKFLPQYIELNSPAKLSGVTNEVSVQLITLFMRVSTSYSSQQGRRKGWE
ncbi:hypothetical protein MKX03_032840, partial [Papaver bracteatum]